MGRMKKIEARPFSLNRKARGSAETSVLCRYSVTVLSYEETLFFKRNMPSITSTYNTCRLILVQGTKRAKITVECYARTCRLQLQPQGGTEINLIKHVSATFERCHQKTRRYVLQTTTDSCGPKRFGLDFMHVLRLRLIPPSLLSKLCCRFFHSKTPRHVNPMHASAPFAGRRADTEDAHAANWIVNTISSCCGKVLGFSLRSLFISIFGFSLDQQNGRPCQES